jgi:hypothetical protein
MNRKEEQRYSAYVNRISDYYVQMLDLEQLLSEYGSLKSEQLTEWLKAQVLEHISHPLYIWSAASPHARVGCRTVAESSGGNDSGSDLAQA